MLCLFGQYSKSLFLTASMATSFKQVIVFCINSVLTSNTVNENGDEVGNSEFLVVNLQAIETLSEFFNKDSLHNGNLYLKLKPYVIDILCALSRSFTDNSNIKLVSTIREIIRTFGNVISEDPESFVVDLAQRTTQKLMHCYSEVDPKSKAINRSTVYECLNLLQELIENKAVMALQSNNIEIAISPIYEILKDHKLSNFNDNIIKICWTFMEITQMVSDNTLSVAKCLLENK